MATNAWGGAGRWALEAEAAEAEDAAALPPPPSAPPELFPSLKEVAAAGGGGPGKSKKKNKGTTLSLSEFTTGSFRAPVQQAPVVRGLTPEELRSLPTGPRERSAEELERARFGGGGGFRSGYPSREERAPRAADFDLPSRADEDDNWGAGKKSSSFGMDMGRRGGDRDRYSSLGSGDRDRYSSAGSGGDRDRYSSLGSGPGFSRADDTGDWNSGKRPMAAGPSRYPSLGSGALDSNSWVKGQSLDTRDRLERPRLVLDPPKRDANTSVAPAAAEPARTRSNPFGAARPREDVLAEKGIDWKKVDSEIDSKRGSRPTSEHSSRPSSAQSSRPGSPSSAAGGEVAVRTRPRSNPFGDAKPREVVLLEKGKDWRKIDLELEHRGVDRQETIQEKELKEEISRLKEELKETEGKITAGSEEVTAEDAKALQEVISDKEMNLEQLIRELDDKVRFGEKRYSDSRPGSGAGRVAPPFAQSGISDAPRGGDNMDRPHSRGSYQMERPHSRGSQQGDSWPRPSEGWGFHNNRDSFGSNSSDRPMERQRW